MIKIGLKQRKYMQKLTIILAKFRKNEYVKVSKKRGKDSVQIALGDASEKLVEELQTAETQFETARFSGLSEEELKEYQRLSTRIKENILRIVLR